MGSGTKTEVAEKLGRSWIGLDVTHHAVACTTARLTERCGLDESEFEIILFELSCAKTKIGFSEIFSDLMNLGPSNKKLRAVKVDHLKKNSRYSIFFDR